MSTLKHPTLYAAQAESAPGARAVLLAVRCTCGHVAFPPQAYGCERCGRDGDALTIGRLDGAGRLLASARVHLHAADYPKAPFTVVEVALDDGPVVRALLAGDGGDVRLPAGTPMQACLGEDMDAGQTSLDLRFVPVGEVRHG
ncbi:hypothetical protein FOZ76_00570 [Verticiella sediminum]|uniref:DUF35 domain-containing protein n=1 Tax=Verticiella sediminum TaxID=1247510 RepID=A0A556B240_9BURK|nr:hypothetical protein [Verticiella sediminum]TSH99256.1 hypothetical protein FOZ76_00570 [Verticiella sediminum]